MHRFGGPEVLVAEETPEPTPGPTDVLIDVAYANITFVETQVRAGTGPFPVSPPLILGNGVGGTVIGTGTGRRDLLGRTVVSSLTGSGGYAERVAVDEAAPIVVPDGLALDVAVALLADGRTALLLAHAAAIQPGDRVLVEAAAGGVGALLVQRAKHAGAAVVAAAGGPAKLEVARDLGADLVVDYRIDGWADTAATAIGGGAVGGVDVVFDGVGGATAAAAYGLLAPGGRMVSYGRASGAWASIDADDARRREITLVDALAGTNATPSELRAFAEQALAEAAAGRLRPIIGQRFPLERAADAHAAIEARTTIGKTLLETGAR